LTALADWSTPSWRMPRLVADSFRKFERRKAYAHRAFDQR
jgi:hypothetical protein